MAGHSRWAQIKRTKAVVDAKRGFVSWDEYIARMFVERDGFQLLCNGCHDAKTSLERAIRKTNKNT